MFVIGAQLGSTSPANDPPRERVLLQAARNAAQIGDPALAIERFGEYLSLRPADGQAALELAGLLRRAERPDEAVAVCEAAVNLLMSRNHETPGNARTLHQLARLTRWLMRYDQAGEWYARYLEMSPRDKTARQEQARLAGWRLRYAEAEKYYQSMVADFPDDKMFQLEWQAKHNNWLVRNRAAGDYYEQALALAPDDVELLFDLGQVLSRRAFSVRAEQQYARVLELAPDHSMAARALEAEQWRRRQAVRVEQSFVKKSGRGREVDITRYRTDLSYAPQRIAEGLDLTIGVGQSLFSFDLKPEIDTTPTRIQEVLSAVGLSDIAEVLAFVHQHPDRRRRRRFDSRSPASHVTLGFDQRFDTGLRAWADVEASSYDQRAHETVQFDAGASYRIEDAFDFGIIAGLQDVIENYVTLHDGLSRYYLGGRFAWQPLRHGGVSGQVRGLWYDDDNSALEFNIDTYYMLSTYPRILKIIGKYYEYHVSQDRFDYWTPRGYGHVSTGLAWHHYLNEWHFEGAPRFFYFLEGLIGLDGSGEESFEGKCGVVWDTSKKWKIGAEASATHSRVYEEQRVSIYVRYVW